jgi:hypothetical protein
MSATSEVPLTAAAATAGVDYQKLRYALIRGEVTGRQLAGRFWVVDLASAIRFAAARVKGAKS